MNNKIEESRYTSAKEKVSELKTFYTSVVMYVLVITILALVNYDGNQWYYAWFLWPAAIWGVSLFFKAIRVFGIFSIFGSSWEARKVQEIMNNKKI